MQWKLPHGRNQGGQQKPQTTELNPHMRLWAFFHSVLLLAHSTSGSHCPPKTPYKHMATLGGHHLETLCSLHLATQSSLSFPHPYYKECHRDATRTSSTERLQMSSPPALKENLLVNSKVHEYSVKFCFPSEVYIDAPTNIDTCFSNPLGIFSIQ